VLALVPPAAEWGRDQAEIVHQLPTISRWIAPRETLRQLELRLEEVATSRLLVDERQRASAWQDAIDATIGKVFEGEGRSRWQRRLYDAAMVFHAAGLPFEAQLLRTQGDKLGEAGFEPLNDGFARGLVEKVTRGLVMPPLPGDEHGDAPDLPPGLIVPP